MAVQVTARHRLSWPERSAAQQLQAAASLATGIAEIGSAAAANIAAARGARRRGSAPNRSLRAARQRDWKRSCRRSAAAYQRCSRQSQPTSESAPRPAASDASEATRRYGTWLLTRRQQNTVLSKRLPSK